MPQTIFERLETKYVLTKRQYTALHDYLTCKMKPDQYGTYTVASLYYDTDRFDLIRASIEKPVYKEKLRLRSYGVCERGKPVFLELKKKYKGIVYKRRVALTLEEARIFLEHGLAPEKNIQILDEIRYFLTLYPVSEKAFICYDRTALLDADDDDLRVTFDSNIRFRQTELSLDKGNWGTGIFEKDQILMEIKTPTAIPLWLSHALSDLQIFPTTFSKYGFCYKQYLVNDVYAKAGDISA